MAIKPVERATLKGQASGYDDYEVYFADSEREAHAFLSTISVKDNQYYVVVEPPGKNMAKDRLDIYNPSRSWRGDDWFSMKWDDKSMEAKQRKHFWRHWHGPLWKVQTNKSQKILNGGSSGSKNNCLLEGFFKAEIKNNKFIK